MKNNVGQVTQVLGAVVDVQFPAELPSIMNALHRHGHHGRPGAWHRSG